jgi:hypothetical protein
MTGKTAGWRGVLRGLTGATMAVGMVLGSAIAHADPEPAPPAPTTTPVAAPAAEAPAAAEAATAAAPAPAPYAEPVGPKALPPQQTAVPKPTVALEGGAAAGTAAAASSATAAQAQPGDVLDQLAEDYAVGTGGGQLSNLLKTSLKLRSMGFRPSKQYLDEIAEAMTHRPNQLPLIGALKDTIAYQQKIQAQTQILQNAQAKNANGAVMGAGAAPGAANPANVAPQAAAPGQAAAPAPSVILPTTP